MTLSNNLTIILLLTIPLSVTSPLLLWFKLKKKSVAKPIKSARVEDYPPAIAELLVNYDSTIIGVMATIIDLAVRRYIHVKKAAESSRRLLLTKIKSDYSKLLSYEKKIMNTLFEHEDNITLNELKYLFNPQSFFKPQFYVSPAREIKDLIQEKAIELKLVDVVIQKQMFKNLKFIIPSLIGLIISIGVMVSAIRGDILFTEPVFVVTWIMILVHLAITSIISVLTVKLITLTVKGESVRQEYLMFREYIKAHPLTKGRIFDEYLPYSIALGVQKKWINKAMRLDYHSSILDKGLGPSIITKLTRIK
jgi:uncharacterized membrane protein